eukprot:gb/GFBE01036953.1/.p1 GENE.gb/GFBE01036953.1/~~gb/GFBE01036953.1/.p1  ORF type:complete len:295 (+),score=39.02 gb/GFBE01036953.1/:1-885(+)
MVSMDDNADVHGCQKSDRENEVNCQGDHGDMKTGRLKEIVHSASVDGAAAELLSSHCIASVFTRPLAETTAQEIAEYMKSRPQWPDTEDCHPLEATWDRVALVDFSRTSPDSKDPLAEAIAYGRNLPPRASAEVASGHRAIAEVTRVLPASLAAVVSSDAAELLTALHKHSGFKEFKLMLEYVRGDTCQRWHCDQNISRALVTYCGPGTICAHDRGVTRSECGNVDDVNEEAAVQLFPGDFLIMKGGLWAGAEGRGCAHRAPQIGPVPTCSGHRLVMKVDMLDDDRVPCSNCSH